VTTALGMQSCLTVEIGIEQTLLGFAEA